MSNIGLEGLDRLYCFMIKHEIELWTMTLKRHVLSVAEFAQFVAGSQTQLMANALVGRSARAERCLNGVFVAVAPKVYTNLIAQCVKVSTLLTSTIAKVGQMQILRLHIVHELSAASKFEAKYLRHAIEVLNECVRSRSRTMCDVLAFEGRCSSMCSSISRIEPNHIRPMIIRSCTNSPPTSKRPA